MPMYLSGMRMVGIGWVVVITAGLSSFVMAKRHVDRKRLEKLKAKAREQKELAAANQERELAA